MSNVVLLMSDEHNPFYASVYGHPFIQTPTMAAMATEGTVYENAYCPSPLCLPCRAAFMSGQRVHTIQTYNNLVTHMRSGFPSYGNQLAEQGVYSVLLGKVDAYNKGIKLGFSETILPSDRNNLHREVGRKPLMRSENSAQRADQHGVLADPWTADLERMDAAIHWLENVAPTLDRNFVLAINLIKPHFPHYATQDLWDLYANHADVPDYDRDVESARHPYAQDLRDYFATESFTEAQARGLRQGYYACVTFVDQQLGRVRDTLQSTELSNTTNLIYTSDHGEMLGKFGMWWKCSLYEDSVRVPCVATGPDFAAGSVVTTPVDLLDVQATLFAVTGTERPIDWVGQPLTTIATEDPERVIFSEYHGHGTRASAFMVRRGDWKLIYYADAPHQLFNLRDDPDELHNLFLEQADIAAELEKALRTICSPEVEQQRAEDHIQRQLQAVFEP